MFVTRLLLSICLIFVTYKHHTSAQNLHYHLRLLPSLVALLPIFVVSFHLNAKFNLK
jgi:hypothetical protein